MPEQFYELLVDQPQTQTVEAFIAPHPVELVSTMPAPNYDVWNGYPRAFTRIAHVLVQDCQPGDLLDVKATFQISNRLADIVEVSCSLVLTPNSFGVAGIVDPFPVSQGIHPPNGLFMKRFPGFNVTPNQTAKFPYGGMHHAPSHLMCDFVVPEGVNGDQYVAIIAYAAGVSYDPANIVYVDQNCGDLSVKRFRS